MAERKSTTTSSRSRKSTGSGSRKSSGSGSRSTSASSSRGSAARGSRATSSRTATSSRNSGRTSHYGASNRRSEESSEMRRDIILVLLFAGMVFLFLSNFDLFGMVGHFFKSLMTGAVGAAAYILPLVIFALTLYGMMSAQEEGAVSRIICVAILYLMIAIVCDLMSGEVNAQESLDLAGIYERCAASASGGGVMGGLFAWLLMHTVGMVGTVLILIVITVICMVFITRKPLLRLVENSARDARERARYRREAEDEYRAQHPEEFEEGFLPDEMDDDATDDDIEAYRAQQAERARIAHEQQMREEARRDVARRHEQRQQAHRTFRGIVGDTNLLNDPYVRQMSEEAAAREAAARGEVLEDDEYPYAGEQGTYEEPAATQGTWQEPDAGAAEYGAPVTENGMGQTNVETQTAQAAMSAPTQTTDSGAASEEQESTGWWQTYLASRKKKAEEAAAAEAAAREAEQAAQEQHAASERTAEEREEQEISDSTLAAQQLLRNQRPGTDGIQLTIPTSPSTEQDADSEDYEPSEEAVRESIRQTIPIHRESSNLHEINATQFQGGYAALASDTVQSEDYDEDLTSRIIREGLADLFKEENETAAEDSPSLAQTAAAEAFRRSSAFTETQHAYGAGAQEQTENPSDLAHTEHEEPMDDPEVSVADAAYDDTENVQPVTETDDVVETQIDAVEPAPSTTEVIPEEQTAESDRPVETVRQVVAPMPEMTTPVGSGSEIAARHAQVAQIHTEQSREPQQDVPSEAEEHHTSMAATVTRGAEPIKRPRPYVYPPLSLLSEGNPSRDSGSDEELRHTAEVLETTLHTFGVNCKITDISQGPAVTRYELLPEQGVKVSKVVGLADDIKLALAATDIRIEAPIPGKSAIGIEVPNKVTSMVALRDILANPNFRGHKSKLAIGVGKDISGQIVVSDLAKMPHVLIAGATGSGKSVCINTIIMSILYHASPQEVKLLMIDPKIVELSIYNGIPHLLYPVVTNPQQAATLLNWAVSEMESRYRKFADSHVRDMNGYNQMIQHQLDLGKTVDEDGNTLRVMPRIVVIVDELADLMMVAKNDVETAICRLAQLARAAGIHLIIATQRPSVDVITGLIKANMPSRIAFAVSSGVDSRTILDMNGAEKLLGKGDMLFFPQGLPKPARIQGAFVTDDEVSDVVTYIRDQNPVDKDEESRIHQQMENLGSGGQTGSGDSKAQDTGSDIDDYFYRAGKFIIEKDNASIGLLQRGFRIGFNRAARLMDQLCEAGVVAESEGTKSRRILMTEGEFEAYCQENDIR